MESSRYALVVVNFVTLLAGMAAIAASLYAMTLARSVGYSMAPLVGHPWILLWLGVAIVVVSVLGMWASSSSGGGDHGDSTNVQKGRLYLVALVALLLVQLVMSTMVLARQADIDYLLNDAWDRHYRHDQDRLQRVERAYACCGWSSVRDRPVPRDCIDNAKFGFVVSCRDRIVGPVRTAVGAIGWAGMAVAGLMGVALALAVAVYGDTLFGGHGGGGGYGGYERESARMSEARQLLREGGLAPHQRQP